MIVEPQVFDLIARFARHPGEVLARDDLIAAVWGGRIVSDSAIASRINAARAALGYVAAALAAAGRLDEAKVAMRRLTETNPFYRAATLRRQLPFADPADRDFILDNMVRAGLPD